MKGVDELEVTGGRIEDDVEEDGREQKLAGESGKARITLCA